MERVEMIISMLSFFTHSGGRPFAQVTLMDRAEKKFLHFVTNSAVAEAIEIAIEKIDFPRAVTHELMKNIIEELGETVTEVTIDSFDGSSFGATIQLKNTTIESRPSDAVALALYFDAPVFVTEEVLAKAGFDDEARPLNRSKQSGEEKKTKMTEIEDLNAALEEAKRKEDYEKCARLRDKINQLKGHN